MFPRALTAAAAAFVLAGGAVLAGAWARRVGLELLELVDEGRRQDERELAIAEARGALLEAGDRLAV